MSDTLKALEKALTDLPHQKYVLRLYVAGNTPHSARAVENLTRICENLLKGRYELSVINLLESPKRAQEEQVVCAPTLVKQLPLPVRKLIGDLSNADRFLIALDLKNEKSAG